MMIVQFEDLNQDADATFSCCLHCGKPLQCWEKTDGVCQRCYEAAEEEPIPFQVTETGRAHVACAKALDALRDEAADIQEGGTGRGFSETHRRLSLTLEAFRETTGNDFFHND